MIFLQIDTESKSEKIADGGGGGGGGGGRDWKTGLEDGGMQTLMSESFK